MMTRDTARIPPAWLLETPLPLVVRGNRPVYRTPLRIESLGERIESGWFDGRHAARDYFVALDEAGVCYWIYRERLAGEGEAEPRWFLHGLFG